jgi:hypothetical protein
VSYFLTDGQFYRLAQDLPLGFSFARAHPFIAQAASSKQ